MSQTKSRLPSLFNPAMQSPDELVANFVIRLKEFDELFRAIKTDKMTHPPQHYMIQGQRGYGKSTLLLRLKIEIENDKELKNWLIPVTFGEEQYGVFNLAGLWQEAVEFLADQDSSFAGVAGEMDNFFKTKNPEEEIYNELSKELKKRNKKIVLLLDNFNDLIRKFTRKDKQRLREVLITSNDIRFICASSAILESDYDYKEPFFDFFKAVTLNELNREETILLLTKLGETYGAQEIQTIIKEQPERIDSLRRLTGGVPRTVVLLFEIFIDDLDGNSFKDLEKALDWVTPLYKHRLDNLSTQQQAIIDAIAQNWDAVSTKEIAAKVRMESKAVSSQLSQLEKNQLIRKIPTSTKNHLYQIKERFFNIYYLMRFGKNRNRNRVLWLVKFFEICCGEKELIERTKRHIKAMQEGRLYDKHAFYVTQALSRTHIPYELQHELLDEAKKTLSAQKSPYVKDIDPSHIDVLKEVISDLKKKDIDAAQKKLEDDGYQPLEISRILADLLGEEGDLVNAVKFYKDAVKYGDTDAMFNLAFLYKTEFKNFAKAEEYYKMAVEKGHANSMFNLAQLYRIEFKNFEKAEEYYKMAVEKGHVGAMNNLALLYDTEFKDFAKAEVYYKLAVEKGDAKAMYNLALLYESQFKDFAKAEEYYKMAIEKGHVGAMNNLALLYDTEFKDFVKAETYYKMAVEKGVAKAMNNLASLFFELKKNKQEALHLQRMAYEKTRDMDAAFGYMTVLLWNDEIQEAINFFESFFNDEKIQQDVNENISSILLMFIAKRQYNFIYGVFEKNKYDIRDKYKPIYYALLSLMGEKYSDELKKMGDELKESVQDVLKAISDLEKDFA
ncbi:MAG: sel1 repeat family protein [Deltaproteobacteria bacterium]